MSTAIEWGRKSRPHKADGGHSPVRFGYGQRTWSGWRRTYVECQCGTRLSGRGDDAGWRSYRRHVQRKERGEKR